MKKIKNYSNKLLAFEVVRLRTLYENNSKIRDRIVKRYRLIVAEYNSRGLRWFWSDHILDKLIKADWCTEKGGVWRTIKGHKICLMSGEDPQEAFRYRQFQIDNPKDDLINRVKKDFSVTDKIYDAGFIVEDGSMLNVGNSPHEVVVDSFKVDGEKYRDDGLGLFMRETNTMRIRAVKGQKGYDNIMVEVWTVQDITPAQWESLDNQIEGVDKAYLYYDVMDSSGSVVEWDTVKGANDSSELKNAYLQARKVKKQMKGKDKITFKVPLIERWEGRGYKVRKKRKVVFGPKK